MDIEGAEYFALKGMCDLLQQHKPVILIEINPFFLTGFNIDESDVRTLIKDTGYNTFIYDVVSKKLHAFEGTYFESNYILIHKDKLSSCSSIIA